MGVKGDLKSPSEAMAKPAKVFDRSPTKVNITKAIAMEPISVVPLIETEILKTDKKLKFTTAIEPPTTDVAEKPEQTKKESIKKNSNAPIIKW